MGKLGQQFEHLTDAQIAHYGETRAGAGPEEEQQIETHLAECPGCRARVLAFHRARFTLAAPDSAARESGIHESMTDPFLIVARGLDQPSSDCPDDEAIRDLAAGLTSPGQAAPLIQHAAGCAHCGRILRIYTEDFSDDLTPEEQALMAQLKSSSPEWQKKMVEKLIVLGRPKTDKKP